MDTEIELQIYNAIPNELNDLVIHCVNTMDIDLHWRSGTFLMQAVECDNLILIDFFIQKGVAANSKGNQAFIIAASNGFEHLIDKFYQYEGTDPSYNSNNAVILAYQHGFLDIAYKLFTYPEVKNTLYDDHPELFEALYNISIGKKLLSF